jgi:hypothetical protein
LTTDVDTITGTNASDLITGVTSSLSSEKTLNSADVIDGGAGTDIAKFDLKTSFGGFTGDGKMTNVENVELTNEGTVARTFTGTGTDGVEKYTLNGNVDLVSMAEISNIDVADRTSNLSVTYASKVTDGKADELTLSLNNVGTAEDATTTATEEKDVQVTIAGIETVNVEAAGVNVVNLDGVAAKAVNVSGAGSVKVTDVNAATKTIDASGMTGNVELAMATATSATLVSTGSGDDKVTVDISSDLTANATVAGGAGDDTLVLTGANTIQYSQSGFETIEVGAGAKTISLKNTEDLANIIVNKDANGANTFASAGAIDLAVSIQGANASAASVESDHTGATTITVDTPTKAGTSTTNNTAATLSKSTSLNMTVAEDMVYTGKVTASKAQSVELAVDGTVNGVAEIATSAVISSVAKDSKLILDTVKLTDLNITNAKALDLSGSDLRAVETFNSTGAGNLTVTALAAVTDLDALNTATITNTGDVVLGNVGSGKDYALSVTSEGSKSFDIGAMKTNDANITLNVIDSLGAVTVDTIDAGKGSVNVTLATTGLATLKAITGKAVTIDASGVLGGTTYGGLITASGDVTITGNDITNNALTGTGKVVLDGTAQTVTFNGGIKNDTLFIDAASTTTSVTVKGDLGLGTDTLAVDFNNAAATIAADYTLDVTGISGYDTGTFTLSKEAFDATVKLGSGTDKDTIQWSGAAKEATITGFDTTEDKLSFDGVVTGLTATATVTPITAGTVTAGALGDDTIYVINDGATALVNGGSKTITDYTSLAQVAAYLAEG